MVNIDSIINKIEKTNLLSEEKAKKFGIDEKVQDIVASVMTMGSYLLKKRGINRIIPHNILLNKLYDAYVEIHNNRISIYQEESPNDQVSSAYLATGMLLGKKNPYEVLSFFSEVGSSDKKYISGNVIRQAAFTVSYLQDIEREKIDPFQQPSTGLENHNLSDAEVASLSIGVPFFGLNSKNSGKVISNYTTIKEKLSNTFGENKLILSNLSLAAYALGAKTK